MWGIKLKKFKGGKKMKESRILKVISYLLIPIIVAVMFLSLLSNYIQNSENMFMNEKDYFTTNRFVSRYFDVISIFSNNLIYRNEDYSICYDGEIQISYMGDAYQYYHSDIEDLYILIQYKDKALTNVELTAETDTIEKIKYYIAHQENAKKVNILAGNVEADSDVMANKAIQYFDYLEHTYYTKVSEELENPETATGIIMEEVVEVEDRETQNHQYITTNIQDFNIYSSYQEKLKKSVDELLFRQFLDKYQGLGKQIYWIMPVGLGSLLAIGLYLIISIGHSKGKEGIDLNDLDRLPLELVGCIGLIGFGMVGLGFSVLASLSMFTDNMNLWISIIIAMYVIFYMLCAISFDTIVKRIKAGTWIKNTLTYRCCRWCWKIVKKTIYHFTHAWEKFAQSIGVAKKLVLIVVAYIVVAMLLLAIFQEFGFLLDLGLAIFLFYKVILRIRDFQTLEQHLKNMYEGNHTAKLNATEFTNEFQNAVKYMNDISNGFENAIQEGIKSERLKTELITNVSHDIKTPLTSIINYVDLLKKEDIENEKANEYIEVLENKSQRLKKLTEDLLEASKASSGNVKLHWEKIKVAELIKQSVAEFEDKFNSKDLEIITNFPEEEISIYADNRYMYRIVENVFSNIAKYSMKHSRVYIDVLQKGPKVLIAIKNISEEVLNISEEELMRRFVRGDKSRTTERKWIRNFNFEKFSRIAKRRI